MFDYEKMSVNSTEFQKMLENSTEFQKMSEKFTEVQENVINYTELYKNVSKCSIMSEYAGKHQKLYRILEMCSKSMEFQKTLEITLKKFRKML